jgi:hypothetical protein
MTHKQPFFLFVIFLFLNAARIFAQDAMLSFYVLDNDTDIPLESAQIAISPCGCGGITNASGRFSISLQPGAYQISINYIGYSTENLTIDLSQGKIITVRLSPQDEQLSEVIVRAKRVLDNIESPQMGALQLSAQELKKIPAAVGEFDVLRGMTLVAGVNNAGEVSSGLSVRGGSLDQNLLLYDYAPVFNPTHLFGLFSVFTPEAVSTVDLYRANIPSRYGGRTTSVLDVKVKNPYVDKLKLSGGIGIISSRLSLETPIVKDKLMLSFGGRAGFTDFLLPLFSERLKNTRANFYDSTLKVLYLPTENDQISFTGFYSKDFYQLDLITKVENINSDNNQYDFRTLNGTLNWNHVFPNEANLRTLFVVSDYVPKIIFPEQNSDNEIDFTSSINYLSFISELSKRVNDEVDYYGGVQINKYTIAPGTLDPGTGNSILPVELQTENSYVFAGFGNINWQFGEKLTMSTGLRFNHFVFVGPYTQGFFDDLTGQLNGTIEFGKGAGVKTYNALEPRLGLNYLLGETTSIKASYARLNQYLQNVYNSTTPLPTSRWKTSDPNIVPQTSDAFGVGLYTDLASYGLELGLEGYYRLSENNLTYKPGADFFLAEFLERDVVQAEGRAYGVELSLKKPRGSVNGWLNYTWSRSLLRSQNERLADRINNNEWFASDFDRPHVLNGTVNFEGDAYNTWSFNFTAQTGRPFTVANGVFPLDGINVPIFLERNNARLRPYHRLDFSWMVRSVNNKDRRWKSDWIFTVYNLYGRRNPFNLYYTQRQGAQDAEVFLDSPLGTYELSVLNSPLFAVTYNFSFQ